MRGVRITMAIRFTGWLPIDNKVSSAFIRMSYGRDGKMP